MVEWNYIGISQRRERKELVGLEGYIKYTAIVSGDVKNRDF